MKKLNTLLLGVFFSLSVSAYGGVRPEGNTTTPVTYAGAATVIQTSQRAGQPNSAPGKSYSPLLPLQLTAPATAQTGRPIAGISVSLQNPGGRAPNAKLRLIIHENDHRIVSGYPQLSPDNVKVEVLEKGVWIPVTLSMVAGNVMGAIGAEGVAEHDRYNGIGFEIPAGLNKTWQLRVTFSFPGRYSLVAAVSPDNGSRHLAQPAYAIITVQ